MVWVERVTGTENILCWSDRRRVRVGAVGGDQWLNDGAGNRGLAPALDSWCEKRVRGGPPHEPGGRHAKHHQRTQREADFSLRTAIETEVDLAAPVA